MEKSPIKSIEVVALIAFSLVAQSLASVFVKLTGRETFLSLKFCLYFGGAILLLGLFAIMWQLLLERIPLSLAYMRKGIVYILILIWSVIFFWRNDHDDQPRR
jgi:hypothetical protein